MPLFALQRQICAFSRLFVIRSEAVKGLRVRGQLPDPCSSQPKIAALSKFKPVRVIKGATISCRVIGQMKSEGISVADSSATIGVVGTSCVDKDIMGMQGK
jgi:hypothetical protein